MSEIQINSTEWILIDVNGKSWMQFLYLKLNIFDENFSKKKEVIIIFS